MLDCCQDSKCSMNEHARLTNFRVGHFRVPRPRYQNEVKCSAFYMEIIFYSHPNKIHFHKKDCVLGLILKVSRFGTRKWSGLLRFIR